MSNNPAFDSSSYFNLDPSQAAKQMAALNAASQARIANGRSALPSAATPSGGTNSGPYLGGITSINHTTGQTSNSHDPLSNNSSTGHSSFNHGLPPTPNSATSFPDSSMSHSNLAARNPVQPNTSLKHRQQGFLHGLATLMIKRGHPLPPALTGLPYPPGYDPTNSPWKIIEPSPTELGSFRIMGKDVDLFKLWGLVFQAGGAAALNATNGWSVLLPHFDLPEQSSLPQGPASVAAILSQYYMAILQPFEEAYRKNLQDSHRKAQPTVRPSQPPTMTPGHGRPPQAGLSGAQGPFPGPMQRVNSANMINSMSQPHIPGSASHFSSHAPQTPQHHTSTSSMGAPLSIIPTHESQLPPNSDKNILDQDIQGLKRKMESEDTDIKRARQKTAGSEPPESASSAGKDRMSSGHITTPSQSSTAAAGPSRLRQQPSRRRIEYIPLAREVDSYGGRDLKMIGNEMTNSERRSLRDINDWGHVDIEALTLSIRSRLSTELSYALTTFTLLSTMKGQAPGSGLPISQCVDLFEEVLDLFEEKAFGGAEDLPEPEGNSRITTQRELVNLLYEVESEPFAVLERRQGSKDPALGPLQRPANIILIISTLIRNLSAIPENVEFLSRHDRLLDLMLRACSLSHSTASSPPHATSPVLSLGDLVTLRKDTLYTLANLAPLVQFSPSGTPSKTTTRMAHRTFNLIASYLVDPHDAVSPMASVQLIGIPPSGSHKPPLLPDIALEAFTRLSQSDNNRLVFAKSVPQSLMWCLFVALVHRLPVVDIDFQLMAREAWLSYLEKTVMAIYSLAFLAPPEFKKKIKADRSLGFSSIMLRIVHKLLMGGSRESRAWFFVCARRAIEAMKVVDDSEDSFDTSKSSLPAMSFGMGYGEIGENGTQKGTGMLGGHWDVAWDMLVLRDVQLDEVLVSELESLSRVE